MQNVSLKVYLATVGMTMTEFAKIVECRMSYISRISTGGCYPSKRLARDIFKATNGAVNIQRPETPKQVKKKEKIAQEV